jgi:hypothetical protein
MDGQFLSVRLEKQLPFGSSSRSHVYGVWRHAGSRDESLPSPFSLTSAIFIRLMKSGMECAGRSRRRQRLDFPCETPSADSGDIRCENHWAAFDRIRKAINESAQRPQRTGRLDSAPESLRWIGEHSCFPYHRHGRVNGALPKREHTVFRFIDRYAMVFQFSLRINCAPSITRGRIVARLLASPGSRLSQVIRAHDLRPLVTGRGFSFGPSRSSDGRSSDIPVPGAVSCEKPTRR